MLSKEEKIREKQRNVHVREKDYVPRKATMFGLHDWLKRQLGATKDSNKGARFFFTMLVKAAPLTKFPLTNWIIKKVGKLGDEYNTKGYSIPLYVDTTVHSVNIPIDLKDKLITPPVELVKNAIRKSEYRVIMNYCICRTMMKCKDYPVEQACMFLGRAAETCVKNGIGHEATVEECLAHVDKATTLGLSAGAYFIEAEQYPWGFPDADLPNYIGFCFCCPCCCHSTKFENLAGGELKHVLQQSVGWHCEWIPAKCTNCGTCAAACPRHYISVRKDGTLDIYDACAGCGQCILKCPNGALHIVQYAETKKQLVDYFDKLHANW